MKLDRRRFLGFSVGAAAGAASGVPLSRTVSDLMEAVDEPVYPPGGPEDFTLSVCRLCPGGCGLRVRRIGGRPVKLDGNPLHPVNGGHLCPKGQAGLQQLYHPDRLPGPMKRTGPRGVPGSFEPATWDEALATLTSRLRLLRQVGRPESLALLRGRASGLGTRVASRFLAAFGSPNDVDCDRGEEAASLAMFLAQGVHATPAFDLAETDYVLSFGSALLEAASSPVHSMRGFGEFRQGRPGRRGKLVQIDSRLSLTGASADEWIGVRAGTEGVLALGLAQVLVAEGLYARDFVADRCTGLDDFETPTGERHPGLRRYLSSHFGLERVAAETGVSSHVVLRIAREFAAARRGLAVGPRRGPLLPGTLFDHLAVQLLNALVGSVDSAGGVLLADEPTLAPWPEPAEDSITTAGLARPRLDGGGAEGRVAPGSDAEALAAALVDGGRYPLEVLLVLDADPVFTSTDPDRFVRALEKVPMVVSFAPLLDDTALYADWVLPQTHFLESWDLHLAPKGVPFPALSLAAPALEAPLADGRSAADVFLHLAREVGGPVAEALPWPDVRGLMRAEVNALFATRRGTILGTEFDEAWVRMMERAGWWAPGYRTRDELWRRMHETGGWWDPFYDHGHWQRVLRTASSRVELRADVLETLDRHRTAAHGTAASASQGDDAPLALVLFEPLPVSGGIGAELPFLQELLDPGLEEKWETWAELHPETASRLGVRDGEAVEIAAQGGAIEVHARVTERVIPGAVAIPVGLGRRGGGRWAAGRGAHPFTLLDDVREPLSGLPDLGATRVRVSRRRGAGGGSRHGS